MATGEALLKCLTEAKSRAKRIQGSVEASQDEAKKKEERVVHQRTDGGQAVGDDELLTLFLRAFLALKAMVRPSLAAKIASILPQSNGTTKERQAATQTYVD